MNEMSEDGNNWSESDRGGLDARKSVCPHLFREEGGMSTEEKVRKPWSVPIGVAYICLIFGVIGWGDTLIGRNTPVLKFDELDKRSGVLHGAGYSGKNQNRWVSLRLSNGEIVRYNANGQPGKIELLQGLVGKPAAAYSQKHFRIMRLSNEELLMEVECDGKKWLDYDYERRLWIHRHYWSLGGAWFLAAIPTLMIILPLFALWRIGRIPDEIKPAINSNSEEE
jgi:hypothetical protein